MGFNYRPRTREEAARRSEQSGSAREQIVKDKYKVWTAKQGDNRVRILPPTWDGAIHFGIDVWAHYQIGLDGSTFCCLESPPPGYKKEDCPLCIARKKAADAGEDEMAKALKPNKRVLVWIIDRDRESDGPQIWFMPWTVDRDLANLVVDERGSGVYAIDDPDKGYDVFFKRTGRDQRTKYEGMRIARESSYVSERQSDQDEWLDFIAANPLPDCVVVATPEHMEEEFNAGGIYKREEDRRDDDRDRGRRDDRDRGRDDDRRPSRDDDRGRREERSSRDDRGRDDRRRTPDKPRTYDELERLSEDEMIDLARAYDIRLDDRKAVLPQLASEFGFSRGGGRDDERKPEPERRSRMDGDSGRDRERERDSRDRGGDSRDDRDRGRDRPRDEPRGRDTGRGDDREGDRVSRLRSGVDDARGRDERPRDDDRGRRDDSRDRGRDDGARRRL